MFLGTLVPKRLRFSIILLKALQICRRLLIFLCSSVIRTSDKVSVRTWMLLDFGRSRRHWVRLTSEWMSTAPPQLCRSPLSKVMLFLTLYQLSIVNYSSSYGCSPSPPPTGSYVVSPSPAPRQRNFVSSTFHQNAGVSLCIKSSWGVGGR